VAELLRFELEELGIHLLAVYPGVVETEFHVRAGGKMMRGVSATEVAKMILKAVKSKKKRLYVPSYLSLLKILGPHLVAFGSAESKTDSS
ncbi:MAG: hypothetical protein QW196_01530, partial [Sulfolobales archaeon]